MSEESIMRVYDRFAPEVEQACANGRGRELLDNFISALATDYAATVFLKLADEKAKASEETEAAVLEWAQVFVERSGLEFVASVTATFNAFSAGPDEIDRAETLAATAYLERLHTLFECSGAGGSA